MTNFKQYAHDVNEDGSVNVRGLEIFKLGTHKGFEYNDEWLGKALKNFETQKSGGFLPSVIIGHNNGSEEKPAKGFLDNLNKADDEVVTADLVKIPAETFEVLKQRGYPHRSVEVDNKGARFTALALLGGTPPYHKLPIMEFGSDETREVIEYQFGELEDAIDEEEKMEGIRKLWWKMMDFIDRIMWDTEKTKDEKQVEVKKILNEGKDLLGVQIDNYKEGEHNMKQFTEEDISKAKQTGFSEGFQEKFGMSFEEYQQKQQDEARTARDSRIQAFAEKIKGRNIAPAIIDDLLVPILKSDNGQVIFAEGDEKDTLTAMETFFDKLFELNDKKALVVDFGEKGEGKLGDALEDQFQGGTDQQKIHAKAVKMAEEKSGKTSGVKFQEEYEKAVYEIMKGENQ